jgi:diguanylate cyclase (GGDEF)-like protein
LPLKSKLANELITLVAKHGLEPFLESTRVLIVLLDPNGKPVLSNPAFDAIRQILPEAATLMEFLSADVQAEFERSFQVARSDHKEAHTQLDFGSEGGGGRYDCLLIPLEDGRALFFGEPVFTALDLPEKYQRLIESHEQVKAELAETKRVLKNKGTELQAVLAQADEVSHTDALTILSNRRQIIADLQRQVMYSDRYDVPFAISMVDIDHFKQVNDTYGHSTGDDVLKFVAAQLREHIRQPDLIGRYGGEEFLVILPNGTLKAASEQAERLCRQIRSAPIASGKNAVQVTISIGIAQYKLHEEDWRNLLNRADQALYQAKHNGRDRWAIIEA